MRYPFFRRRAAPGRPNSRAYTFVSPVRGWVANENIADGRPGTALVLENWFPTSTGIRLRGGSELYATIGEGPVESLFCYNVGTTQTFFAADEENIFNITGIGDPDTPPSAAVSGQGSGYYSTVQFGTSGDDYIYAVNGVDEAQLYDGSSWIAVNAMSSPAITGVDTDKLSQVWVYRNRLYFIQGGSMVAWYLPVDVVGGAATDVSMQGIFQRGGSLLFGATWSLDAGDGVDDKCVFVSTQGEMAIYEGSAPSEADWRLVGRYDITEPLGKNAWLQAGGDLLIMTHDGIVPVSEAISKDPAALTLAAITRAIEPEWKRQVAARKDVPWQILKWPGFNMAIVSQPVIDLATPPECLVANLQTGAWCKYTGWDTRSLSLYGGHAYFGTSDGRIFRAESGGTDDGAAYTCSYVGAFDPLRSHGVAKIVHLARAVFRTGWPFTPKISVSVNYAVSLPNAPNAYPGATGTNAWDVGEWDEAVWSGVGELAAEMKWVSVGRSGFAIAPQVQISVSQPNPPATELVSFDLVYETGGVVV